MLTPGFVNHEGMRLLRKKLICESRIGYRTRYETMLRPVVEGVLSHHLPTGINGASELSFKAEHLPVVGLREPDRSRLFPTEG